MKYLQTSILFLFLFVACREPEAPPTFATISVQNAWKAGYVRDNSNIITGLYNSWRFTFNSDGTLIVNGGGTTMNGTWEENIAARKILLFINSSSLPAVFASREWDLVFLTPSRIKLADNRFSPVQELYLDKP
ncbi:MAG: hypothetical protein ACK5XN_18050 [Bacteroidota bacterium]